MIMMLKKKVGIKKYHFPHSALWKKRVFTWRRAVSNTHSQLPSSKLVLGVLAERPNSTVCVWYLFFWFNLALHVLHWSAGINITFRKQFYDPVKQLNISQVRLACAESFSLAEFESMRAPLCVFVMFPTGQWRPSATDGEREQFHHTLERQEGHHGESTRRTQMEITNGCSVCLCVRIDLPACVRVSRIRDSFEQVSCFSGKNEGAQEEGGEGQAEEAGSRRVRKKGFVPVNLYGRYFMPGCLSREKHLVQITGGKKIKSHAAAVVEIWNKLFMPAPSCSPPPSLLSTLSVGFQNMSAAVGQEGYSVESQCYYKTVWGEKWDNILVMDTNSRVLT